MVVEINSAVRLVGRLGDILQATRATLRGGEDLFEVTYLKCSSVL